MAYEITIFDVAGELEATFVPDVGMVGVSLRHHGEELLHQGGGLSAYETSGSTFAIPLLHPWANRVAEWSFDLAGRHVELDPESAIAHRDSKTGTAIHGLLAASPHWTLVDADRDALTAELNFGAASEYMAAFPFPHRVRYTATVAGSTLTVAFTVIADQGVAIPISFGFHPFFTLPGSDRRSWHVEIPVAKQSLIDDRMLPTGELLDIAPGELNGVLGDRTFDTSYPALYGADGARFVLADDRRQLALTHVSGYPVSQVFTPERADFICFEPMTAPVDALISGDGLRWVAPGEEFTAMFTVSVENL